MVQKGWAASAALLCIIVIFTVLAAGSHPKPVLIGYFAELLIPGLLTIYFLVLLYSARTIIDMLASFLLGNRRQDSGRGKSWMVVIGYAIGTVLIVILIRSAAILNLIGAVENAITATSALRSGQGLPAPLASSATNPYLFYYVVLIFVGIVIVSFSLLLGGIHTAYRWVREERSTLNPDHLRRETLRVVQQTAKDLRVTDDYRGTILNCYREMCRVLSLHGFQTEFYETASEFSKTVSGKLGLGGDFVRGLTLLFEEARYSDHSIDTAKRAEALTQLESLDRSLDTVSS